MDIRHVFNVPLVFHAQHHQCLVDALMGKYHLPDQLLAQHAQLAIIALIQLLPQ